mmetsp:Transcript_87905/g.246921  ORF Transcript_87905/g.246921 Transcript_87905/m.246921 type:complete len:241 (+) Transcript_87905:1143-1865(+)
MAHKSPSHKAPCPKRGGGGESTTSGWHSAFNEAPFRLPLRVTTKLLASGSGDWASEPPKTIRAPNASLSPSMRAGQTLRGNATMEWPSRFVCKTVSALSARPSSLSDEASISQTCNCGACKGADKHRTTASRFGSGILLSQVPNSWPNSRSKAWDAMRGVIPNRHVREAGIKLLTPTTVRNETTCCNAKVGKVAAPFKDGSSDAASCAKESPAPLACLGSTSCRLRVFSIVAMARRERRP